MTDEFNDSVEGLRKKVIDNIARDSERLMEELKIIAFDREVDVRVRLQAIGMLLDRSVPKLAVDNTKVEGPVEDTGTRKKIRQEILRLVEEGDGED
jgi:hypothetical protein